MLARVRDSGFGIRDSLLRVLVLQFSFSGSRFSGSWFSVQGSRDEVGRLASRDRLLRTCCEVLDRHGSRRAFVLALQRNETDVPVRCVLELLANLIGFRIELSAQSSGTEFGCESDRFRA